MKHDVMYSLREISDIDELNVEVDDLRLTALASLEELHQLLTKYRLSADANGWKTEVMLGKLETTIQILRRGI